MGGGQAVRHGPLEPAFVGSNPTRPAFSKNRTSFVHNFYSCEGKSGVT